MAYTQVRIPLSAPIKNRSQSRFLRGRFRFAMPWPGPGPYTYGSCRSDVHVRTAYAGVHFKMHRTAKQKLQLPYERGVLLERPQALSLTLLCVLAIMCTWPWPWLKCGLLMNRTLIDDSSGPTASANCGTCTGTPATDPGRASLALFPGGGEALYLLPSSLRLSSLLPIKVENP